MKKNLLVFSALSLSLAVIGCQSTAGHSDKSADIQNLEQQKAQIETTQEDVLAPKQYKNFTESLAKAKDLNSEQKDATEQVELAKGYVQEIHDKSKPTQAMLAEVIAARRKALDAGAGNTSRFREIDKDLKDATQDASNGNIKTIEKERAELQNRYANVEGDAIVFKVIGADQTRFNELKKEKADASAPTTFERTESKLADAERSIRADRYNPQTLAAADTITTAEVARLDKINTDAKRLKSEPAAVELYEKDQVAIVQKQSTDSQARTMATQNSQLQNQLSTVQTDQSETAAKLSATQGTLSATEGALSAAQDTAAKKLALEQKFSDAKKAFTANEADVFKDGENLLIRLKGLSFEKGKGALPASSQALLKKLGSVVAEFGTPRVRIEGHTDSTGSVETNARLSEERAGIVKSYLVSEKIARDEDIVAQGLGEVGPVATNKTAAGRAQNRRVDVIVQPTY